MTQLEEYVISYRDATGNTVCNLTDYYAKFVVPLAKKFEGHFLGTKSLALCPLHDDHDPSLGMLLSKKLKGAYRFNCLGCGRTGSVVRFHQYIQEMYYSKRLSTKEACLDLCSLFEIPIPSEDDLKPDDFQKRFYQRLDNLDAIGTMYNRKEYARELFSIRKRAGGIGRVNLDAVNRASVKMIATKKELYG